MVRKWSNQNLPGALHFITGNLVNRIPIFRRDDCCEAFLEICATLLKDWPCKLIAFVLMPDHLHLIVNPRDGQIKSFTAALKSVSAKRIVEVSNDSRFLRHTRMLTAQYTRYGKRALKGYHCGAAG